MLRQAAKQQDGREDKGCADPEELRTDDSSWRHRGGRLVRMVHQGGKARSTGRIARCVVLWLWDPASGAVGFVPPLGLLGAGSGQGGRSRARAWQAGHVEPGITRKHRLANSLCLMHAGAATTVTGSADLSIPVRGIAKAHELQLERRTLARAFGRSRPRWQDGAAAATLYWVGTM